MNIEIKAEGVDEDGIKILLKAIKKLYCPYEEYHCGLESFNIKVGDEE